jgi:hypothetical protein
VTIRDGREIDVDVKSIPTHRSAVVHFVGSTIIEYVP